MRDYRNIFNKVVPYHTDNSMSLYEFVGRLYEYLKDFEGSLDEAHEKIDEFITQFGKDLSDTTKGVLTDWHDDGTLAELIKLVWDDKADKYYVDNLINRTANALVNRLTDDFTQVDDVLEARIATNETQISNLANGSPKGTYATVSELQTAFPTGNGNIYVVIEDGNWYYYQNGWKAGGIYQSSQAIDNLQSKLSDHVALTRLPIKNELLNSDFSKGEVVWTGFSDTVKIVNQELVIDTGTGVGLSQIIDAFNGDDMFYLILTYKTDGVGKVYIRLADSPSTQVSSGFMTDTHTQFKTESIILTTTGNGGRLRITRSTETPNTVTISNMMLINLTKSFGKGNEPNKTKMDDFIINLPSQWFEGHLGSNVFLMNLYNFIEDITIFEDELWEVE